MASPHSPAAARGHCGRVVLCVLTLLAFVAGAVGQAPKEGTGYDPRNRGLTQARWIPCFRDLGGGRVVPCPVTTSPINFNADPWAVPAAQFRETFEARYGAGSASRKKWEGVDNEIGWAAQATVEWACSQSPSLLGIQPGAWNCRATAREIEDFKAVNDRALLAAWWAGETPGGNPNNPREVQEPGKPCEFSDVDPFWGLPVFFRNTACTTSGGGTTPGGGSTTPGGGTTTSPDELPLCEDGNPGAVLTPAPAPIYYRPGLESTGRIRLTVVTYACRERP